MILPPDTFLFLALLLAAITRFFNWQLDEIDVSVIAFGHRRPIPLLLTSRVARQSYWAAAEVSHFDRL
jgi:hypothetical protein